MRTGQYDVYHEGRLCERINVVVDGYAVTITGPRWNGRGVYGCCDGIAYLGVAVCPNGTEAYHTAQCSWGVMLVQAMYPGGTVDVLEWRPVEPE
jgi:hypothetical protein